MLTAEGPAISFSLSASFHPLSIPNSSSITTYLLAVSTRLLTPAPSLPLSLSAPPICPSLSPPFLSYPISHHPSSASVLFGCTPPPLHHFLLASAHHTLFSLGFLQFLSVHHGVSKAQFFFLPRLLFQDFSCLFSPLFISPFLFL